MPLRDEALVRLRADAAEIIGRYPRARSALLPLLHLVQSEEGYVSDDGIAFCAEALGITETEVRGVSTFYTMYKDRPVGEYQVGVCTNTLCAIMGGDEIYAALVEHLGADPHGDAHHDVVSQDGTVGLERVECNAACDYAPVVMVNWEFFDNQTPDSARKLIDDLRAGNEVRPTRGPSRLCTWKQASRILAGFGDGQAAEGPSAGPASLVGLELAKEHGWTAPPSKTEVPSNAGGSGGSSPRASTEPAGGTK
jgi:NADH-quinone oxidoreductase subunit E